MENIRTDELFRNCLYSSIAHAVYTLHNPFFAYEQSWDNYNYNFHFGSSRGTISFDLKNKIVAGAMRKEDSSRVFLYPNELSAEDLFRKASEGIVQLSTNETLMYLYDTIGDFTGPVATTGFWLEKEQLFLCDSEPDFLQHGGEYLKVLLNNLQGVKKYWKEQYGLSNNEIGLADEAFRLYFAGEKKLVLDKSYKAYTKQKGYEEMLKCFAEIGITVKVKTGLF